MKRLLSLMLIISLCFGFIGCAPGISPEEHQALLESAEADAYQRGLDDALSDIDALNREARRAGYDEGFEAGKQSGYIEGKSDGYSQGYGDGLTDSVIITPAPAQDYLQSSPESTSSGVTVYITKTGAKYHKSGCSYLKSKIEISLSDAKAQGYTACSRCDPPK